MAAGGDYSRNQRIYGNMSGALPVTALLSGTFTLTVVKVHRSLMLQKVHFVVASPQAGATWQLIDSTGVPITPAVSVAAALPPPLADIDLGAEGYPLTEAASLQLVITGGGAIGAVTWEAYSKQTSTMAMSEASTIAPAGPTSVRGHEFVVGPDSNPGSANVGFTT